ncbi:MAG: helix-turn-helix domain-containing protein [Verrucomicrobiaceae bacterium]
MSAPRKAAKRSAASQRRSPCPVSCALDIFGDRWTLLVIRDLMLGRSRFKDFAASPESVPTNILSDRLRRLLQHGIVEQLPAAEGAKHLAYKLTEKGEALRPVLKAMKQWGLDWEKGTKAAMEA